MRGSLAPGTLIAVVRALHAGEKSGVLELVHGNDCRKLLFHNGTLKFASTNVAQERLGQFLLSQGRLRPADLDKAIPQVGRGERLGQILVRLGLLKSEDLQRHARDHILHIIYACFSLASGEYCFEEVNVPLGQEIKAGLSISSIIMEAVRRMEPNLIVKWMSDTRLVLRPGTDPALKSQPIALQPQEGFLLSRVDGQCSVDEILAVSPLPAADSLRTLLGLWCAGLIEHSADPLRLPFDEAVATLSAAASTAAAAPGSRRKSAAAPSGSASTAQARRRRRASRAGSALHQNVIRRSIGSARTVVAPSRAASQDEERSREVLRRYEQASEQNLYELLSVNTTAEESEIRRAYYGFAKRLHPDRFQTPQFELVRQQAERLFAMLTEAYNILCDPDLRKHYDQDRAVPEKQSAAEQKQQQDEMARQNFMHGKLMLQKGKFHEALRFFENAVKLDERRSEYFQYLASVQMKNPKLRRQAEKNFLRALKIDPSLVSCYVSLGSIYRRLQLDGKAESMFRTALQWDPDHPVAKKELDQGAPKAGAGLSSVFKGIFKK
ncbi:MAG: DUF4388 domain-containing protein [Acidobacteriota bacterium]